MLMLLVQGPCFENHATGKGFFSEEALKGEKEEGCWKENGSPQEVSKKGVKDLSISEGRSRLWGWNLRQMAWEVSEGWDFKRWGCLLRIFLLKGDSGGSWGEGSLEDAGGL